MPDGLVRIARPSHDFHLLILTFIHRARASSDAHVGARGGRARSRIAEDDRDADCSRHRDEAEPAWFDTALESGFGHEPPDAVVGDEEFIGFLKDALGRLAAEGHARADLVRLDLTAAELDLPPLVNRARRSRRRGTSRSRAAS